MKLSHVILFLSVATWASGQSYSAPSYSFTTLAGAAAIGSADGPGNVARFDFPRGIALDAAGNLYVADGDNQTIRKITPTGIVSTLAGKAGYAINVVPPVYNDGTGSNARFAGPTGVATDAAGNVFVSSDSKVIVRKVTADGTVTTQPGGYPLLSAPETIERPIAIDSAGNAYITDDVGLGILKITPSGITTTLAGGSYGSMDGMGSAAQFGGVKGMTIDSSGNLYVTDTGNPSAPGVGISTIRKVTPTGVVTTFAGVAGVLGNANGPANRASFNGLVGITIDLAGNLYVADSGNAVIRKITPAGIVSTLAGQSGVQGHADGGPAVSLFFQPYGLAVDQASNLYVSDLADQTIRKITPAGIVYTIAGLSPYQCVGFADGVGTDARFRAPEGVAVGPSGELYVADLQNHTIRKIMPNGVVSTLAGSAGSPGYFDGNGPAARFSSPNAVTADAAGNVYVTDQGNSLIRKITPAGTVSTMAGRAGISATTDGPPGIATFGYMTGIAMHPNGSLVVSEDGDVRIVTLDGTVSTLPVPSPQPYSYFGGVAVDAAGNIYALDVLNADVVKITLAGTATRFTPHFLQPYGIAVDKSGNVFVTGRNDNLIWEWATDGTLSILGGMFDAPGGTDGVGEDARFESPSGIAVDAAGNIYVTCSAFNSNSIRKGQLAGPPVITAQPQNLTAVRGSTAQFSVTATGAPSPAYQWYFNGAPFNGATSDTLILANVQPSDAGNYTVVVANSIGTVTSNPATLTVSSNPVTPPATPASDGGGGGAPSLWFIFALLALGAARAHTGRRPAGPGSFLLSK